MKIDRSSIQYKWDMHWLRIFFTNPDKQIGTMSAHFRFKYEVSYEDFQQLQRIPDPTIHNLKSRVSVFASQALKMPWLWDRGLEDCFDIADRLATVKTKVTKIVNGDRKELSEMAQEYRGHQLANVMLHESRWAARQARNVGCNVPSKKRSMTVRVAERPTLKADLSKNKSDYTRNTDVKSTKKPAGKDS